MRLLDLRLSKSHIFSLCQSDCRNLLKRSCIFYSNPSRGFAGIVLRSGGHVIFEGRPWKPKQASRIRYCGTIIAEIFFLLSRSRLGHLSHVELRRECMLQRDPRSPNASFANRFGVCDEAVSFRQTHTSMSSQVFRDRLLRSLQRKSLPSSFCSDMFSALLRACATTVEG